MNYQQFRQEYRRSINPNYSGIRHCAMVVIIGIAACFFCVSFIENPSLTDWIAVPVAIVLVNFAEYFAHRWLGHKKTKLGRFFYQRHTGDHHSFFVEHDMNFESTRDWRVVLFPTYLIAIFIIFLLPVAMGIAAIISNNSAALFAVTALLAYMSYEILHFSYHLPTASRAYKWACCIPGWLLLRQSHALHHNRQIMQSVNFNITLPLFDYLLGTRHTVTKRHDQKLADHHSTHPR